jgi:hypothetical protein
MYTIIQNGRIIFKPYVMEVTVCHGVEARQVMEHFIMNIPNVETRDLIYLCSGKQLVRVVYCNLCK